MHGYLLGEMDRFVTASEVFVTRAQLDGA